MLCLQYPQYGSVLSYLWLLTSTFRPPYPHQPLSMPPQGDKVTLSVKYRDTLHTGRAAGSLLFTLPLSYFVESRLFSLRVRTPSHKEYFCKERRQNFSQRMPRTPYFASPTVSPAWFLLCSPRETWSKFSPNKPNELRWTLDSWIKRGARRGTN